MRHALLLMLVLFVTNDSVADVGDVLQSYSTPAGCPTGLTFDGSHVWLADRKTDLIYKIDPANGAVDHQIPSPGYWPMGLAWDGETLWNVDSKTKLVYQIDPTDGTILKRVETSARLPMGLTFDGAYLWVTDERGGSIEQISPDDGTTITSLNAPLNHPQGITFDGAYLWASDRYGDEIHMLTPDKGWVLAVIPSPGPYPHGLTWDGEALWCVDYQNDVIQRIKVMDEKNYVLYDTRETHIEYTHQIRNNGPGTILDANVFIALPKDLPNQNIVGDVHYADDTRIVQDTWNQDYIQFTYSNIPPTGIRNSKMTVTAELSAIRYYIRPEKVGSLDDIPQDIRTAYTIDGSKYRIDDPLIQKSVKEAVGDETNPYWIARNIYQWLMGKMYYELVGGWNIAPTVLARGNGSCSEYTFVYISMCRAAGLPARYVGSVVHRGDDAAYDDVFHRWVEVYLPNYGWIPVDPSGGDRDQPRHQSEYFGHLSNRFLITTLSGGDSEILGWTYNSAETFVTEPKTAIYTEHIAEWDVVE